MVTKKKSAKKAGGERRELIDTGTDKRYVKRRREGTFKESDDVGKSLAADRRQTAKKKVKPGYGDQGDQPKRATKKGQQEEMKQPADPMPLIVEPMLPTLVKYPFSNADWLFEPKWDGLRAICFVGDGQTRFVSRNKKSLTAKFPALQSIAKSIRATTAVLDGEIVAVDETGTPRFNLLRAKEDGEGHVVIYYAFDLLYVDGTDLTQDPIIERKALLKRILPRRQAARLRFTDHVLGDGKQMFAELSRLKLEGMVAKRCDSVYVGGRTRAWLKVKSAAGKEEMLQRSETWGH